MIAPPAGTKILIAAGVADMCRGFHGLGAQVQTVLEPQPLSGHVFVFRGRRGDILKVLWFDGDGLCLLANRLERERFVWPQASSSTVFLNHVMAASKLHADDTPVPVLAPGNGRTKTGRLWTYVRDDRPSGDATAPAVWFAYCRTARARTHAST